MKINFIFPIAAACILCLAACNNSEKKAEDHKNQRVLARGTDSAKIVGLASIEPKTRIASLYSEVGGLVKKINYDINDEVKEGEVIVELNTDVEQAQLSQALSKLSTQQAIISSTKAQYESQKAKNENAQLTYNRNYKLFESGAVTQQVRDDSRYAAESSLNDAFAAQSNIKQQQAKLSELQADINYDRKVIDRKQIKAPANGRILSLDAKVGSNVIASQSIGDFAPDGPLIAVTEVDELFASKVHPGMKAYVRPQGGTDTLAIGTVYLASPYLRKKTLFADDATNMEDRRVREVRIQLDENKQVLIGSRVECVILLK